MAYFTDTYMFAWPGLNELIHVMLFCHLAMGDVWCHHYDHRCWWWHVTLLEGHFITNHQQPDCLINSILKLATKEHQSSILSAFCERNPPITVGFLSQRAIVSESISMSWLHDEVLDYIIAPGVNIFNTLRPRQHGRHFPDDIFRCIFLNENDWISLEISLKFVSKIPINNIPALVQIMAWRRSGDKPLSEPMMVRLPTHICVTRPQWVNSLRLGDAYRFIKLGHDQFK